ncbi:MAG: hypothetical protein HYZ28_08670 [Myxococcales bacterium]|nr:hypothetical protein [Myxococcales bacterium]
MRAAIAACGALLVLAACKKEKKPAPPAPAAVVPAETWKRGELPLEVQLGAPVNGGAFTVRIWSEPAGLNRLHDQMAEGWMIKYLTGNVYEALAELDRDTHPAYELRPLLAEGWTESPDHKVLTVRLRKGVKFHNGEPFTSKDVKAVLEAVLDLQNLTTNLRSYFTDLESYEAPDDYTFVVRWKKPYFLANRNFLTSMAVMPASALEGDFNTLPVNRSPIGTGPFRFVSWETGKAITFDRNDSYWGKRPHLDRLVVRIVKDHTVATQLWERGEFDLMTLIQPAVWKSIESGDAKNAWAVEGYHRIYFLENIYFWIGWNEERPFFKDRRVREALARLYPTESVRDNIDLGLELPTTCPYYRESDSCDSTVERLPYDRAGAKRLLAEAGWKDTNGDGVLDKEGVPFKFTFLNNPYSVRMGKLVPLLQEEFRKVGIEMDIEKAETPVYIARMRAHDFDAASMGWSSLDPQQDNFQIFHSSQSKGGSNYVSYAEPEVDRLLEEIRVEFDRKKRNALERRLHRRLYEDQVYLFMTNRPYLDAVKKHVRGIKPSLAWYDLRKTWIQPSK